MSQLLVIQVPWRGEADLRPALIALVYLNVQLIPLYHCTPLYSSGVRYKREGKRRDGSSYERWLTAPEVLRHRHGDCEDLAGVRAAELILAGDLRAMAIPRPSSLGWHIVVQRGDGSIEDPSRKLGM